MNRVTTALQRLASAIPSVKDLERDGYALYKLMRPSVAGGARGWGARGEFDLGYVGSLTERARNDALAPLLRR